MENFSATKFDESVVELTDASQIEKLYKCIQDDDNFILEWKEGDVKKSRLIIATDWAGKIKTGDISITASEGGK